MKNHINTQNPHYQSLLPLAREVRKEVKMHLEHYVRVYTEPRKDGLRTKFFAAKKKGLSYKPIRAAVDAFNAKYPEYVFTVDNNAGYYQDFSITIKKR
jgi:hypothetical protein